MKNKDMRSGKRSGAMNFSVFVHGKGVCGAAMRAGGCSGRTVVLTHFNTEFLSASFFIATGNFYLRRFVG